MRRSHRQPDAQRAEQYHRESPSPHLLRRPFFFLHSAFTTGCRRQPRLACPMNLATACCLLRQRSSALTSRPRLPAFSFSTNLLTGASGTIGKVPRIPPLEESIRPATSTSTPWPRRAKTRSGRVCEEERR